MPVELWGLIGPGLRGERLAPGCMAAVWRRFRAGVESSAFEDRFFLSIRARVWGFPAGYGHGLSTPVWRLCFCDGGRTLVMCHDVSRTGGRSVGLVKTSTTSMVPRWQCGHVRKDTPVNAS
jgi:hypothetical protein